MNFAVGPNDYPFPSFFTITLLLGSSLLFFLGAFLGARKHQEGLPRLEQTAAQSLAKWENVVKYGSWISAIGSLAAVGFNLRAGKSFGMAIYNTEVVRQQVMDEMGPTSVVMNAFGFTSYSWLVITLMLCRYRGGFKRHAVALVGSLLGVAGILAVYVVNVNRTAFLVLLLFLMLYVGITDNGRWAVAFRRLGRGGIVAAVTVVFICTAYFVFIAVARADRGENERFVSDYMQLRYRMPLLESWDYDFTCGLYKLQWYASHQIRNMDQVVSHGETDLLKADGRLFFAWPINQVARIYSPLKDAPTQGLDELAIRLVRAGAFDWQWCTALLIFCNDFGVVGACALVFLMGLLIGWSYRGFILHGSAISALVCFWWGVIALLLFVNFPIDNFVQTNIFLILALKFYFSILGAVDI